MTDAWNYCIFFLNIKLYLEYFVLYLTDERRPQAFCKSNLGNVISFYSQMKN